jgi:hypothetical protein
VLRLASLSSLFLSLSLSPSFPHSPRACPTSRLYITTPRAKQGTSHYLLPTCFPSPPILKLENKKIRKRWPQIEELGGKKEEPRQLLRNRVTWHLFLFLLTPKKLNQLFFCHKKQKKNIHSRIISSR